MEREQTLFLLLFFSFVVASSNASKIIIVPFGMYSHISIFTNLGSALKEDGHEVWVLAFDIYKERIEANGLVPLTFPIKREDHFMAQLDEWMEDDPEGKVTFQRLFASDMLMAFSRVCDSIMQSEHLMTTIEREKFDLLVFDGSDNIVCHLMIPYKFDIPFVTVHAFQTTSWVSGVTGMPSIEPEINVALSNRMDFWERIKNLKSWWARYNTAYYDLYSDHHMGRYCPPHKPKLSLKKVAEMSEMYLMNFEIMCVDYPRVSAPNMQYLGGSTATPAKPLPEDLEAFMASAEHGVVLMSMGSTLAAQQIWKVVGEKLFDAFGRLPQKILVQYRLDEIYGNVPDNVKLVKWIPQNDLLGHPKIQLFIMHGGNNGQNEAVYHGVPMIVMPVIFDQLYSAKRIQAHAYGHFIADKNSITSDELYQMMTEVINNETYSKNVGKCSRILKSMPSAQEKFVFWVNHILEFGGAHLRPPSLDMPLYQVLMLDIVAYYLLMGLVALHGGLFILYLIVKRLFGLSKAKKD